MDFGQISTIYSLRSNSTSTKIAFIASTMALGMYGKKFTKKGFWQRIPDSLQVSQTGFGFRLNNYFFAIINKIIQQLSQAGVMEYKIGQCFRSSALSNSIRGWNVLAMDQLSFGFNIWLGCCVISIFMFLCEVIIWIFKRKIALRGSKLTHSVNISKLEFAQVYPKELEKKIFSKRFPNDQNVFKIKK